MKTISLLVMTFFLAWDLTGQGWVRQNPIAQFTRLNDVDFDGLHGLTVGNDGILFTTHDGGNTWVSRKTPDADENLKTAFVLPGTNGQTMLAGGDSLVLLSTNGGINWSITWADIQGIYKIERLPSGEWLILGKTYSAKSLNQGLVWLPIINPDLTATAGYFTSAMHGWMDSGPINNRQIKVTTDGGQHWEIRDSIKFISITDLEMVNDTIGYLATGSQVYKTLDGGFNWNSLNANPTADITDLYVISSNEIWASLSNGNSFYSLTSGSSWVERQPDLYSNNSALAIYANLNGQVYMPGKYTSMLYSNDFGFTWRDQIPGTKVTLFQPHFYNEFIGLVGGAEGIILVTVNGGADWIPIQFPKVDNFFAAAMVDDHSMVIGSSRGRVYYSQNLGGTWDTIGTDLGQVTDIAVLNQQTFIITTKAGRIYKTSDQGTQWNIQYDNGGIPLFALDFPTQDKGWACGYQGEMIATTTGGDDWTPQATPGKAKFSDIAFTSDREGWAVSTSFTDSLWYTLDGGQVWSTTSLPYQDYWNGISFTNRDTGWIAGGVSEEGDILRTNDRGLTWSRNHTSPELFNGIYAVPEIETVWAVGFGGNIMKYTPCETLPLLANLTGIASPCKGDTVQYSVTASAVDHYNWIFPTGWEVISNPDSSSITVIAGDSGGQIQVFGSNVCGNMSAIQSLTVTPTDIPEIIIEEMDGHVLFTNLVSLQYQWILNGVPIPGATDPFYTAIENGNYQLMLTVPGTGCSGFSNVLEVTITGTADIQSEKIEVFPVPAKNILYVSSLLNNRDLSQSSIVLFSPNGAIARQGKLENGKIDVSGIRPGFYILMLRTQNDVILKKVLLE